MATAGKWEHIKPEQAAGEMDTIDNSGPKSLAILERVIPRKSSDRVTAKLNQSSHVYGVVHPSLSRRPCENVVEDQLWYNDGRFTVHTSQFLTLHCLSAPR